MNSTKARGKTGETQLVLESVLDVSHARPLYAQFERALARAAPIVLDAGQVERIDTAAMQVLSVFQQSAHERGIALRWSGASHAIEQADRLLGLGLFGGGQA